MFTGEINVTQTAYQLKMTANKRIPLFLRHANGLRLFSETVPYNYNDLEKEVKATVVPECGNTHPNT